MLLLVLFVSAATATKSAKESAVSKQVIEDIKHCTTLDAQDIVMNVEVFLISNMSFCCECAQKAVSYYKRGIAASRGYTLVKASGYALNQFHVVLEIMKKMYVNDVKELTKRSKPVTFGCAVETKYWLSRLIKGFGKKIVVCLLK